ncbi:hypothetical protein BJV82DRAFT_620360 [Fennellomyces sp. T-0311]|nr:hypothetical protein BJV82DRAFT_620360 [Fennellomyces sp. T-0311]
MENEKHMHGIVQVETPKRRKGSVMIPWIPHNYVQLPGAVGGAAFNVSPGAGSSSWSSVSPIGWLSVHYYKCLQDKDRTVGIHRLFPDPNTITFVGGGKVSEACSMQLNESRDPAAVQAMERKRIGTKTDMLSKSRPSPLDVHCTCETGKHSSINSSKSIDGASLKCSKTMKDMLLQLVQNSPQNVRKLSTYGFTISDFPAGYVCRVSKLPERLQFSASDVDCIKKPDIHQRTQFKHRSIASEMTSLKQEPMPPKQCAVYDGHEQLIQYCILNRQRTIGIG